MTDVPNMIDIDYQRRAEEAFDRLRGHAIGHYAMLEQALANLFAELTGMKLQAAGTIFFKITNAQARDRILERLLKQAHGSAYSKFWSSYKKMIENVSHKRNNIVHWMKSYYVEDPQYTSAFYILIQPDYLNLTGEGIIAPAQITEFIDKCKFLTALGATFWQFLNPTIRARWIPERVNTWSDIFQREVIYPTPPGHPLHQIPKIPDTPLPTSQG